jgi:biopolymer transport protein ExbD
MATNIIKRQRKRRRIDTDGDPEFQVAPMVDVLLVLMLFFMAITTTELLKKDPSLKLPDAKNAVKPKDHKNEIVVNVKWDSLNNVATFVIDQKAYPTADDLQDVLASLHARKPAGYIVIRADKNTEYSNIADLMNACASAGISTVSFATLIGGAASSDAGGATSASK